ncbi:MAG: tyrosine-type recombinase/integrase, partial [Nitrospiraceae bacterium]
FRREGERMGLTRRRDSYYVEFSVIDDGKTLSLALPGTGKLKRWKVGCLNRRSAKDQEALIKTRLMSGQEISPSAVRAHAMTFRNWADIYLGLEEVLALDSYATRKICVDCLVEFFGDKLLTDITPEDVRQYRAQRVQYAGIKCGQCWKKGLRRKQCACGWVRQNAGKPVSIQTVNHDHAALITMLNIARSPAYRLISDNPAAWVDKPDPKNERDRVATPEEWGLLKQHGAPHLIRFVTIAHDLGPRKGELLKLEWPDVDMRRREFKLRETKNGEPRLVPMTDDVYAIFVALWQERRLDTQRVFLYNEKPCKSFRTAYHAACRRAGITNLRIHDFRHTASTNLRRAGVDTMTAMKIVGHKSEKMHRRYNQIVPEDLHAAAVKLDRYTANTLITLANSEAVGHSVSACNDGVGA